jgi:hypothetical protein
MSLVGVVLAPVCDAANGWMQPSLPENKSSGPRGYLLERHKNQLPAVDNIN